MTTRKFSSRFPLWFWVLVAIASIFNLLANETYQKLGLIGTIAAVGNLYVMIFFLHTVWRRLRYPAVEVTDESVFVSGLFRLFSQRMSVPLSDVAELLPEGGAVMTFRMHSGELRKLPIDEIRPAQRDEVRRAIEAALAAKAVG